ncbi:MAG: (Fe-S)-binding protein [Thermodesulfobacteriota bacterium]
MKDSDKKSLLEEAAKCVRCGACKSACPTFDILRREPSSPRGRVSLIEARYRGAEGMGDAYARHIKECTLCGSCLSACPKAVNVPELVLRARSVQSEGEIIPSIFSLAAKNLLGAEGLTASLVKTVMKAAGKLQGVFLKEAGSGLITRFPLPFVDDGRLLPELPEVFFLDRPDIAAMKVTPFYKGGLGGIKEVKANATAAVGFFVGCGINYMLPSIGEATIKALDSSGASVAVPAEQVCCGMPALSSGDRQGAKEAALRNIEAFEKLELDYIVTSCATCGHALKNVFKDVLSDEGIAVRQKAEVFASKVRDITELLARELVYEASGERKEGIVTYHDPCHLKKYQGITEEPRELLAKSGHVFKGMKNPCKCCGLGGGLTFTNYPLSMEIAEKKAMSIKASGADIVATACPGCIIQIKDACHRYGVDVKVVHVVELL